MGVGVACCQAAEAKLRPGFEAQLAEQEASWRAKLDAEVDVQRIKIQHDMQQKINDLERLLRAQIVSLDVAASAKFWCVALLQPVVLFT